MSDQQRTIPPLEGRFSRRVPRRETPFGARQIDAGDGREKRELSRPRLAVIGGDQGDGRGSQGATIGRYRHAQLSLESTPPAHAGYRQDQSRSQDQEGREHMAGYGDTTLVKTHHSRNPSGADSLPESFAGASGATRSGGFREINGLPWWFWAGTMALLIAGIIRMLPHMK